MTPERHGSGRFMVEQGTNSPIWLGHRGFLGGGGQGVINIKDFHNRLPNLREFLQNNRQHLALIPQLTCFDQVFAYEFAPDDLVVSPQNQQRVFPIAAAAGKEEFFRRLASYVHQCYILGAFRVSSAI